MTFYDLHVTINPADSSIAGTTPSPTACSSRPGRCRSTSWSRSRSTAWCRTARAVTFRREGNAFFATLAAPQRAGERKTITVYYHGKPADRAQSTLAGRLHLGEGQPRPPVGRDDRPGHGRVASGGRTRTRRPTSRTASASRSRVPDPMIDVSNGRLRSTTHNADGTTTYEWFVVNPINNYAIAVAGRQLRALHRDVRRAEGHADDGLLAARLQPRERAAAVAAGAVDDAVLRALVRPVSVVRGRLQADRGAQHRHGAPERRRPTATGIENGYRRRDGSGTGLGLKWDFIIVHESAHEWWGNNITTKDNADMWVHESFANYAEGIYTECLFGKEAGARVHHRQPPRHPERPADHSAPTT